MNWQIIDTIKQYEKPGDFNFASVTDVIVIFEMYALWQVSKHPLHRYLSLPPLQDCLDISQLSLHPLLLL